MRLAVSNTGCTQSSTESLDDALARPVAIRTLQIRNTKMEGALLEALSSDGHVVLA